MTQPLVSLCIPTYNGRRYLADALRSAQAQTYPHIEILIADDASTDGTAELAHSFIPQSRFPIRVLGHPNLGAVGNWNFCLTQARGQYIKYLFQDDLLEPTCVQEMVELAQSHRRIGLVFAPRHLLVEQTQVQNPVVANLLKQTADLHRSWTRLDRINHGPDLLGDPKLLEGNINKIGEPSVVMFRRSLLSKTGPFHPPLRQLCDLEMWWRIMAISDVGFIDHPLASFRLHLGQETVRNIHSDENRRDYDRLMYRIASLPLRKHLHPNVLNAVRNHLLSLAAATTHSQTPTPTGIGWIDRAQNRERITQNVRHRLLRIPILWRLMR